MSDTSNDYPYYGEEPPIELQRDREQALKWGEVIRQNGTPKELDRMVRELADAAQNPAHVRNQLRLELHHEFGFRNEDIEGLPLYKLAMMILGCAIFYVEDSREARRAYRNTTHDSVHHVEFWKKSSENQQAIIDAKVRSMKKQKEEIKQLKKQIREQKDRVIRTIMLKEDT